MSNVDNLIAANLLEKDDMKVALSASDASVSQYNYSRNDQLDLRVSTITVTVNAINDSFIVGNTSNAVIGTTLLGDRRSVQTTYTADFSDGGSGLYV